MAGLAFALGLAHAAASSARAEGCGGHRGSSVASMADRGDPMAGFELLGRYGGLVPEPAPKAPCSGPSCSGRPMAPLPVPIATVEAPIEQWGCLIDPALAPPRQRTRLSASEPAPRPSHQGPSVFHPPRLGSPS